MSERLRHKIFAFCVVTAVKASKPARSWSDLASPFWATVGSSFISCKPNLIVAEYNKKSRMKSKDALQNRRHGLTGVTRPSRSLHACISSTTCRKQKFFTRLKVLPVTTRKKRVRQICVTFYPWYIYPITRRYFVWIIKCSLYERRT